MMKHFTSVLLYFKICPFSTTSVFSVFETGKIGEKRRLQIIGWFEIRTVKRWGKIDLFVDCNWDWMLAVIETEFFVDSQTW